jgi:hypothetical protein
MPTTVQAQTVGVENADASGQWPQERQRDHAGGNEPRLRMLAAAGDRRAQRQIRPDQIARA